MSTCWIGELSLRRRQFRGLRHQCGELFLHYCDSADTYKRIPSSLPSKASRLRTTPATSLVSAHFVQRTICDKLTSTLQSFVRLRRDRTKAREAAWHSTLLSMRRCQKSKRRRQICCHQSHPEPVILCAYDRKTNLKNILKYPEAYIKIATKLSPRLQSVHFSSSTQRPVVCTISVESQLNGHGGMQTQTKPYLHFRTRAVSTCVAVGLTFAGHGAALAETSTSHQAVLDRQEAYCLRENGRFSNGICYFDTSDTTFSLKDGSVVSDREVDERIFAMTVGILSGQLMSAVQSWASSWVK